MKLIPTEIPGVLVIEPLVHRDPRGFLLETYHAERFKEAGIELPFVQDNHSRSLRGTLRGLHAQHRRPQGKLVRVLRGEIYDVAVDLRPGSETFGRWTGAMLSAENFLQMWVPPGLVHGFCVTSDEADVLYKCTDVYAAGDEIGVRWDDPQIGIAWPVKEPLLSVKDAGLPTLEQLRRRLGM